VVKEGGVAPLFFPSSGGVLHLGFLTWFWATTVVLAVLLYRPVKRVIYVGRVRTFERKAKRAATDEEQRTIEKKTVPLVVVLVVTFSFLFNRVLMAEYFLEK
jgi:hypothetical protein